MGKLDRRLASNATFLFLDWLFVTLLNFIYWSVAGKTLLPGQYGIVSTSINFATLLSGIGMLGFNTAVCKLLPEYIEKKQGGSLRELIRFSLKTILISNAALIILLLLASPIITTILKIPTSVIFVTAVNMLLVSLWTYFAAVLTGIQNMKKIVTTNLAGMFVKVFVSAALVFLSFSYFGPLFGYMVGVFVVVVLRIPFKFLAKVKKEVLDKKQIFFDFALPAFTAGLALLVFSNGQYVLLTAIKNPEVTGIFAVALILTNPIISIPNVLTTALFPIISQLSLDHNSKGSQRYLINMVFRYALFFSMPIAILLIFFSNNVILLFSRSEYLPASALFPILAIASVIYGIGNVFNQTLYSLGKPKTQRNIILATVLLFFSLAIPLTIFLSALGICLAYLMSVSFLNFASYKSTKKILKIRLPWDSVKKILVASLFLFLFLYAIARSVTNIFITIILCAVAGLVYLEILFLLKFYTKQDVVVLQSIAEKSPVLKKQLMGFVNFLSKFV